MNMHSVSDAVKSICEKDPTWWVRRRVKLMGLKASLNDRIRAANLARQPREAVLCSIERAVPEASDLDRRAPRHGTFIFAFGRQRCGNTVFAGKR